MKYKIEIWGLTGGIASGKSLAAKFFSEMGVPVLDADQVSRELSAPGGAAHEEILSEFGTADREELRKIVFNDPGKRKKLEAILHPLIRIESMKKLKALADRSKPIGKKKIVLYEAALLVESGRLKDFDGLILVESPESTRKERLMARDKTPEALASKMLSSQESDDAKRKDATVILDNSGTQDALKSQIKKIIDGWKK